MFLIIPHMNVFDIFSNDCIYIIWKNVFLFKAELQRTSQININKITFNAFSRQQNNEIMKKQQ